MGTTTKGRSRERRVLGEERSLRAFQLGVVLASLAVAMSGCAMLRLNGCRELSACGDLAAYSCSDDLICADADGKTIRAEPVSSSRNPCHICASADE
jgi:hypothetical protein